MFDARIMSCVCKRIRKARGKRWGEEGSHRVDAKNKAKGFGYVSTIRKGP